ncbi:MAG TPA: class I SAM-dependent methyltransferase [Terriglobales bacterium]|nr:class I SAM-dependent methyltransferase [Terriglobales bacterium]
MGGREVSTPARAVTSMLNQEVRQYWEKSPCGVPASAINSATERTREWFEATERARYAKEPFIHQVARFPEARGKRLLEVGVGAGVDHLQWARAGADCYGVDLTDTAIELTRQRLALYGLSSRLQRADAESLPFDDNFFDVVYSWGVIHHSEHPEKIVDEIHRILKPGGAFIGMMYHRRSLKVLTAWAYYALLRGRPWRTFRQVVWQHVESKGTKAYTFNELKKMFAAYSEFSGKAIKTPYDTRAFARWLHPLLPDRWGWFFVLRASK